MKSMFPIYSMFAASLGKMNRVYGDIKSFNHVNRACPPGKPKRGQKQKRKRKNRRKKK